MHYCCLKMSIPCRYFPITIKAHYPATIILSCWEFKTGSWCFGSLPYMQLITQTRGWHERLGRLPAEHWRLSSWACILMLVWVRYADLQCSLMFLFPLQRTLLNHLSISSFLFAWGATLGAYDFFKCSLPASGKLKWGLFSVQNRLEICWTKSKLE